MKEKKVTPTPELLKEMEELEIYGGEEDVTVHAVESCESNTYCKGANCFSQCGCTIQPVDPVVHTGVSCGATTSL